MVAGLCLLTGEMGLALDKKKSPSAAEQAAAKEDDADALEESPLSAGQLQTMVMDFSDQYTTAMCQALDEYLLTETDPARRVAAQQWKVRYGAASMAIAAARDPRMSLLDMTVFITAGKWAVDSYWVPKVFGSKASGLSDVYREMDERIWGQAARVLSLRQQSDLRTLIRSWERQTPSAHGVTDVRLRNLEGVRLDAFQDESKTARGILASVRRLLGRVDTSLLYGERMMFCLTRTPHILTQQTDLTLAQIAETFPLAALKPELFSEAFEKLPSRLQEGLDSNGGSLQTVLPQVGAAFDNVNSLVQSLDKSLVSLSALANKTTESGILTTDPAPLLREANQALAHLDSSVEGFNRALDKTLLDDTRSANLLRLLDEHTDRAIDAAFRRLLILLGVFFAGMAALLLLAKFLFTSRRNPPPAG